MLPVLLLATAAVSAAAVPVAPISVQFTSDSVYTKESIIKPKEVIEEEDTGLYTIVLEEDKLLGYAIYDINETEYIDGLKFDDSFVKDWIVEHVDLSVAHTISVKTVYTDDTAGMLVAAKDGDWSKILSNPLIIFQLVYYSLAAVSIIAGGIGLFKAKAKKLKDHNQIAKTVSDKAAEAAESLKNEAVKVVDEIVTPALNTFKTTQDAIIKAFILSQSGDKNAALSLVDLLKESATTDFTTVADDIKKAVTSKFEIKEKVKEEAAKAVKQISEGIFKEEPKKEEKSSKGTDVGGISI